VAAEEAETLRLTLELTDQTAAQVDPVTLNGAVLCINVKLKRKRNGVV
jgi:hypothetical protein